MSRRRNICIDSKVIIWANSVMNHIDIGTNLHRYEDSCMVFIWTRMLAKIKILSKYVYPYPIDVKTCEILVIDT